MKKVLSLVLCLSVFAALVSGCSNSDMNSGEFSKSTVGAMIDAGFKENEHSNKKTYSVEGIYIGSQNSVLTLKYGGECIYTELDNTGCGTGTWEISDGKLNITDVSNLKGYSMYADLEDYDVEEFMLKSDTDGWTDEVFKRDDISQLDIKPVGNTQYYNFHSYQLYKCSNIVEQEMMKFAEDKGFYICHINSKGGNEFIHELMTEYDIDELYFGYTDIYSEGDWQWLDGVETNYTNWKSGEPNKENNEEYFALMSSDDGKWNNGKFNKDTYSEGAYFICESNSSEIDMT